MNQIESQSTFELKNLMKPDHDAVSIPQRALAINNNATLHEVLYFSTSTGVWQVMPIDRSKNMPIDSKSCTEFVVSPHQLLENPAVSVLGTRGGNITEKQWMFRSSREKKPTLNSLVEYLDSIQAVSAIKGAIRHIADEFFTNAIYNAPFYDDSLTLDRSSIVVLDPEKSAKLITAYNDHYFFIGCTDFFGNLNNEGLLKHLSHLSHPEHRNILDPGKGGAGIGLYQVLQHSNAFISICEVGKQTLFGCVLPIGVSSRRAQLEPKQIHFHSFQDLKQNGLDIRVERRGKSALVSLSGNVTEFTNMTAIDLSGLDSVTIDSSSVDRSNEMGERVMKKWVENLKKNLEVNLVQE